MSNPLAIGSTGATGALATGAGGLPVTNEAHAPAVVREGSATVKQAYASAQGFEEMLLQQLSQSMLQSSGLGEGEAGGEAGSGEEGASAGSGGMLASLLPQSLTEGVMRQGGLGIAGQLLRTIDPAALAQGAPAGGSAAAGSVSGTGSAGGTAGATGQAGGTAAPAQVPGAPVASTRAPGAVGSTGGVSA